MVKKVAVNHFQHQVFSLMLKTCHSTAVWLSLLLSPRDALQGCLKAADPGQETRPTTASVSHLQEQLKEKEKGKKGKKKGKEKNKKKKEKKKKKQLPPKTTKNPITIIESMAYSVWKAISERAYFL